jgi:F0F1-type ATP synthase membrane subunit b/b'
MARRRKIDAAVASSEVVGKLGRLLETEAMLEAMLKEAKQQAREIVDTARREADAEIRRCESHLEHEHRQLRERIEREREQTIESIRREAGLETSRLEELDDEQLRRLAQHVVDFVLGGSERGGSP